MQFAFERELMLLFCHSRVNLMLFADVRVNI
jgi:hypothetical protein